MKNDSESRKEILFVINTLNRGGAERVTSILAGEFAKRGWHVHVLTYAFNAVVGVYELPPEVDYIDISGKPSSLGLPYSVFKIYKLILRARKIIRQIKPEVTISIMSPPSIFTCLASTGIKNFKHISSERAAPERRGKIRSIMTKYAYSKSSACVMQTERAKNFFSDKIKSHSTIIYNPVSVKTYAVEIKRPRIVTAGRLAKEKNHKLLIDSFNDVHKLHPEYTLDIYGHGILREKLQAQIDSLGLHDSVKLCGNVPDIHEKISDAEIFCMSSNFEGMSNALIEAMMMGLACISTDTAGAHEIIDDGKNGLIVPVGNREKLTQAILKLIEDKETAKRFGNEARKCEEKFSVQKIVDEWEKLIIQVIDSD